jgi:hypothetical protein
MKTPQELQLWIKFPMLSSYNGKTAYQYQLKTTKKLYFLYRTKKIIEKYLAIQHTRINSK